jgi:hypothetical protein
MRSSLEKTAAADFIDGGCDRLRAVARPRIQAEVHREYAGGLQAAGPLQRIMLKVEMRREITRRLDKIVPPWALY